MKRIKKSPGVIIGVIALVFALAGGAYAAKDNLKLGMFEDSSRDRLAGTGVIQYAATSHVTPTAVTSFNDVHSYEVKCELSKKATSGGFKWTGSPPPSPGAWELVDAYPTGQGFVVRMHIDPAFAGTTDALGEALTVYANCVKSRTQRGTPPL
jgi:hypothetical protein